MWCQLLFIFFVKNLLDLVRTGCTIFDICQSYCRRPFYKKQFNPISRISSHRWMVLTSPSVPQMPTHSCGPSLSFPFFLMNSGHLQVIVNGHIRCDNSDTFKYQNSICTPQPKSSHSYGLYMLD